MQRMHGIKGSCPKFKREMYYTPKECGLLTERYFAVEYLMDFKTVETRRSTYFQTTNQKLALFGLGQKRVRYQNFGSSFFGLLGQHSVVGRCLAGSVR
mmetsp:Transcript_23285/g.45917  ORF Transcript_23285/g.45917 Transcript_23285/m.45917 type:complete len:98 (+) Transcript_23285:126-419(+)